MNRPNERPWASVTDEKTVSSVEGHLQPNHAVCKRCRERVRMPAAVGGERGKSLVDASGFVCSAMSCSAVVVPYGLDGDLSLSIPVLKLVPDPSHGGSCLCLDVLKLPLFTQSLDIN